MPSLRCFAAFCENTLDNSKDKYISFHNFPRELKLRNYWLKFCNIKSSTLIPTTPRLCSDHFLKSDFTNFDIVKKKRRCLRPGVIPTQKLMQNHNNDNNSQANGLASEASTYDNNFIKSLINENNLLKKLLIKKRNEIYTYKTHIDFLENKLIDIYGIKNKKISLLSIDYLSD